MRRCVLLSALVAVVVNSASAQTQAGTPQPTEQSVFSLYVARHEATARFAELGTQATDKDVREFAEHLRDAHRNAGEKLEQSAQKESITIIRPTRDTSDAMLASAIQALKGKTGRELDSTFAVQAYAWLATLMLDNNIKVLGALPDGELKKFGQAYGRFVFHQAADAGKLKKKYETK